MRVTRGRRPRYPQKQKRKDFFLIHSGIGTATWNSARTTVVRRESGSSCCRPMCATASQEAQESYRERETSVFSIQYSVMFIRGNGVTLRTQKVIQGGDNGHVGRPCEVSPAPPCPELFCELRGLCRHSYFGPRTCGRSEKTKVIEVAGS